MGSYPDLVDIYCDGLTLPQNGAQYIALYQVLLIQFEYALMYGMKLVPLFL